MLLLDGQTWNRSSTKNSEKIRNFDGMSSSLAKIHHRERESKLLQLVSYLLKLPYFTDMNTKIISAVFIATLFQLSSGLFLGQTRVRNESRNRKL